MASRRSASQPRGGGRGGGGVVFSVCSTEWESHVDSRWGFEGVFHPPLSCQMHSTAKGSIAFEIFIVVTLVTPSCSNRLVVPSARDLLIDWRWPVKLQIRQRAVFACSWRRREESEHITLAALNQPNERLCCFRKPAVVKQLAVQKVTVIPWCCSRPLCPRTERKERGRVKCCPVRQTRGLQMRREVWVAVVVN